jgi:5'-methylthioadenosine phosphorylase
VEAGQGVTHAEVLAAFARNLPQLRELLLATLAALPAQQGDCSCRDGSGVDVP